MARFDCFKYLFVNISIFVRKRNVTPLKKQVSITFYNCTTLYNGHFFLSVSGRCGDVQLYFEKRIEAVHTFASACSLLQEKRKELGDAASKLRNGLDKIDDTRAKVLTKEY